MRPINILYFILPFLAIARSEENLEGHKDLFICYGKVEPSSVKGYGLVIIEAQHYGLQEIKVFKQNNKRVLGYISLTEVHEYLFYYNDILPFTFGKNVNWNSSFINLSNPNAQKVLCNAVSKMMAKGLDGLFLDNIDNVSQWGRLFEQKRDLVNLVKNIKQEHKDIFLIQNSGLFLTEELKKITDAILVESVITNYDFKKKEYRYREAKSKAQLLDRLANTKKQTNKPIFLVEYVGNERMREKVAIDLHKIGYPYFIANINLQSAPQFQKR